ncbi:unnamed protein product, partial [Allacma fusca]
MDQDVAPDVSSKELKLALEYNCFPKGYYCGREI